MSLYTTILHPGDGRELQIKTGDDVCAHLGVGDAIPWAPDDWNVGRHVDGVYDSYGGDGPDDWVVVKGCIVVAVEPRTDHLFPDAAEDERDWDVARLSRKWGIGPVPRGLWTEAQWAARDERAAKAQAEMEARVQSMRALHPDMSELSLALAAPMSRALDYVSIGRMTFLVAQLPDADPEADSAA